MRDASLIVVDGDIGAPALTDWLSRHVPDFEGPVAMEKFAGGQSNPTYRITAASGCYVLRRKPFGTLLPSAHAIEREYRLLRALDLTAFPVPKAIALCEDPGIIGASFYVMEMVEGRTFWSGVLPGTAPAERRPLYEQMVKTLAGLHNLDHRKLGLETFGRAGNYMERQIARWTMQYRATTTDQNPLMEKLIDWLPRSIPAQSQSSIIHGDYRIDNLIFDQTGPQVRAVLDWELATIGDPLADFAYLAMHWVIQADGYSGLGGIDLPASSLPTLAEIADTYCAATQRPALPSLHWYFAFNLFRLTAIVQGVKKRLIDGNASNARAEETAARLAPLSHQAWTQAQLAGAR